MRKKENVLLTIKLLGRSSNIKVLEIHFNSKFFNKGENMSVSCHVQVYFVVTVMVMMMMVREH